jgi:hypothetical protein
MSEHNIYLVWINGERPYLVGLWPTLAEALAQLANLYDPERASWSSGYVLECRRVATTKDVLDA